jgi:hydroxyethylthiazole kinase-like uncharacterized protein yjeF
MKIVTAKQMRALDSAAIEKHGIRSLDLMERAGAGLADAVLGLLPDGEGAVLVIAGSGNNGGDGLVAARLMKEAGADVEVIVLSARSKLSPDAQANFGRLSGDDIHTVESADAFDEATGEVGMPDIIVDAIFGTGIDREVSGLPGHAIDYMNGSGVGIVSADIPSGLSADTGEVMGRAVRAACTVTFGLPKAGFFAGQGPEHAGCVSVVDIGIPQEEIDASESNLELNSPDGFVQNFAPRGRESHKGTYGHVAVFAGSGGHLGAGYLASLAALRAGCGLVTYCLPGAAFEKFDARYPEVMCEAIPDDGRGAFGGIGLERALEIEGGKQAVAIGPAIGTSDDTKKFVNAFLLKSGVPAVIDADALNVLDIDALERTHASAVLTPHPGEMARLMGVDTKEIQADRVGFARSLADRTGAVVVLKGNMTVVAEPRGQDYINFTGNPGMATAGMGDVLTGMIAAFIARGMEPIVAARAAVYVHGLAGDMAAKEGGEESLIASDVISGIGRAIEALRKEG